jgi:ankyrin repeat protein
MPASERFRLRLTLLLISVGTMMACAQHDPQNLALRERIEQGALVPEDIPRFRMSEDELRAASEAFREQPRRRDSRLDAELLKAARTGDAKALAARVSEGARVNVIDEYRNTPLRHVAASGDLVSARLLIKAGADVEGRGASLTPLSAATMQGQAVMVRLLLKQGADPNASGLNGLPPLVLAVRLNQLSVAAALLQAGARTDVVDRSGEHLLMLTINNDQPAMADLLLSQGMNPDIADVDGLTPLYWAQQLKRDAIAERLKQAGAQRDGSVIRESRSYPMGEM